MTDASQPESVELRRKRLRIRAWRRGTREMDLILGRYADRHLATMSEGDLDRFETALEIEDPVLYDWILGRSAPPEALSPLVTQLALSAPKTVF